jgi:hypothetical protein
MGTKWGKGCAQRSIGGGDALFRLPDTQVPQVLVILEKRAQVGKLVQVFFPIGT